MLGKKAYSGPWSELSGWMLILIVLVILFVIIVAASGRLDIGFLTKIGG